MQTFLQLSIAGVALGAVYGLIALGFVIIYRATRVFNFAHGELLMFGAFLMVTLLATGLPWVVALALAAVVTGLVGATFERTVLRRFVGRPIFVPIIITILFAFVLRVAVVAIYGVERRGLRTPWEPTGAAHVGGVVVTYNRLATIVAASVALYAVYLVLQRTRIGVAMRAIASDQEAAMATGVPVGRLIGITWFLSGAAAAIAGVFLALFPRSVDPSLGFIALRAFPAVLVGGLDSPTGAVVAGLGLGVLEVLTQGYVNPQLGQFGQNLHTVLPYAVMILVLMVRPYGLFGSAEIERV